MLGVSPLLALTVLAVFAIVYSQNDIHEPKTNNHLKSKATGISSLLEEVGVGCGKRSFCALVARLFVDSSSNAKRTPERNIHSTESLGCSLKEPTCRQNIHKVRSVQ